jgi:hypothetical protein
VNKQESQGGGNDGGSPPAVVTPPVVTPPDNPPPDAPPPDNPPPPNWDDGLTGISITTNKTEYFVGEEIIVTVYGIYNADTENPHDLT